MIRWPSFARRAPVVETRVAMRAQPIVVVDPELPKSKDRAMFRLDQILRDRERRVREELPRHGDHQAMTGEAIERIGILLGNSAIDFEQAMRLIDRLKASE